MLGYFSPWLDHDRATQGEAVLSALKFVHKLDSIQEKSSMNWLTMRNESRIAVIPKKKQVDVLPEELLLLKHVLGHELLNNHSINLRAPGTVCSHALEFQPLLFSCSPKLFPFHDHT